MRAVLAQRASTGGSTTSSTDGAPGDATRRRGSPLPSPLPFDPCCRRQRPAAIAAAVHRRRLPADR